MRRQTGLELLDAEGWKGKLRELSGKKAPTAEHFRSVADQFALMKANVTEVKKIVEDGERVLEFVISDGSVDRDYDTIRPKGWDLKAYRKNPVVLWAHDSRTPPIARSLSVKIDNDQLIARAEFCPFELNPFADMIFRMFAEGYMRTASVGFRGLEMTPAADDEDRQRRFGLDFLKQELLEWSAVPVPANANALMRAHEAGINTRPLKSWAEMVLDLKTPLAGIGTNDVERAWAAVRGPSKLYVWFEASEEPEVEITVDPEPEPAVVVPANPEPVTTELTVPIQLTFSHDDLDEAVSRGIASALKESTVVTFSRRADGQYTVLRGGLPIAVVEDVNSVEWDEQGILSLRSADSELDLSDYTIELEETQSAAADELIEIEEPEPAPPAAEPELSADDVMRAFREVMQQAVTAAMASRS